MMDELQVFIRVNTVYKIEHVFNNLRRGSDVPAGQRSFASASYGGGKDILGGDSEVDRFKSSVVFIDEGNGKRWFQCSPIGTRFEQVKSSKHIFVGLSPNLKFSIAIMGLLRPLHLIIASTEYELTVGIPVHNPLNDFTLKQHASESLSHVRESGTDLVYGDRANFKVLLPNKDYPWTSWMLDSAMLID